VQISNKQKYHKSKWSDELNIVFSTENHIGHHNTSHSPFNMYADKTISQQKTKLGVRSDLSENNFFSCAIHVWYRREMSIFKVDV